MPFADNKLDETRKLWKWLLISQNCIQRAAQSGRFALRRNGEQSHMAIGIPNGVYVAFIRPFSVPEKWLTIDWLRRQWRTTLQQQQKSDKKMLRPSAWLRFVGIGELECWSWWAAANRRLLIVKCHFFLVTLDVLVHARCHVRHIVISRMETHFHHLVFVVVFFWLRCRLLLDLSFVQFSVKSFLPKTSFGWMPPALRALRQILLWNFIKFSWKMANWNIFNVN